MQRLIDAANGLVRLVTLAPERDEGFKTIQMLAGQGIVIAAGHTDASLDTLRGAIDSGLSIFTHLGNGCPMQMHRHDNIIQRALHFSQKLWFTFIADGAHVPFFALKNYLRCADIGRSIIVSDAIAPAGLGPGRYTLGRWNLEIGADMVAWAPDRSHLVGAAITMKQSAQNLRSELELSQQQIKLMTEVNPRKAIGI
jgi:N-acetylglucosamine-6-phosphate deacetylase